MSLLGYFLEISISVTERLCGLMSSIILLSFRIVGVVISEDRKNTLTGGRTVRRTFGPFLYGIIAEKTFNESVWVHRALHQGPWLWGTQVDILARFVRMQQ